MGSGVSVAAEIDDAYIQQQLKIAKRKIVVVGAAEEDAELSIDKEGKPWARKLPKYSKWTSVGENQNLVIFCHISTI